MVTEALSRPALDALPDGWRIVAFGDVVRQTKTDAAPETSGLERYIAGEHMGTDDLHIRSWGTIGEGYLGPAFHRKFIKGQVLYGSRRTYLRKVAVADFDGICANTTFVLEPANDQLIPELLPFVMQTDTFNDYSVKQSRGSVNPYVNFRDIATYRFPLPPREEQRRIADILWAADAALERWRGVLLKSVEFRRRLLISRFEQLAKASPTDRLDRLGQIQLGRQRAPKYQTGHFTHKYLRVVNVLDGELDLRDVGEMDFDPADFERYGLQDGDILITEGDLISPLNVGRSAVFHGELPDCCFQNTLIRFRVGPRLSTSFAHAALQNAFYRGVLAAVASTTTVTHLGAGRLGAVQIAVPSKDRQDSLVHELNTASVAIKALRRQSGGAKELATALRTALLG